MRVTPVHLLLFLTGMAQMVLQFLLLREFASLLYGFEITLALLLMAFFGGYSLGYLVASRWPVRLTLPLLALAVGFQAAFPFAARWLVSSCLPHHSKLALVVATAYLFLSSAPLSLLLPLALRLHHEEPPARGLAVEFMGGVAGLVLVALVLPWGNAAVVMAAIACLGLVAAACHAVLQPALPARSMALWAAAVMGVMWGYREMHRSYDAESNSWFYARSHNTPRTVTLFSRYSPYQKVDVLFNADSGSTDLYLDGFCHAGGQDYTYLNVYLGDLPGAAARRPAREAGSRPFRNALVFGSGSLWTPRYLLQHCDRVTNVELDATVVEAGLRFYQMDGFMQQAREAGRWRVFYDDGKHFVRTTDEEFDLIALDLPSAHTIQFGSLGTVEFFQWCRDRMPADGVLTTGLTGHLSDRPGPASYMGAAIHEVFADYLCCDDPVSGLTFMYASPRRLPITPGDLLGAAQQRMQRATVRGRDEVNRALQGVPPMRMDALHGVVHINREMWKDLYGTRPE